MSNLCFQFEQLLAEGSSAHVDGSKLMVTLPALGVEVIKLSEAPSSNPAPVAVSVNTTAQFSTPGTYVLQLAADDGALSAVDQLTIVVN